ncbi:MAG: aromatic hydrocarbon degradation protein [Sulfurovum sp.]|nr:MAG: aromatic hydrocarbon degradation protein [Sulfurovum sp.]
MNVKTTKTIAKLVTLSLITSTMLHATNGDNLISVGTKARGMGGTSMAVSHGAESGLSNGALITSVEGTEISFGGIVFMPEIKTQFLGQPELRSKADMNMIPEVSIAHKIDDNWYIGIGMWGTAGMGTDYSSKIFNPAAGALGNFNMVTNLQLLQFGVPIAYKTEGFSVAVTPIMQYGNLDINYHMPLPPGSPIPALNVGAGLAQDFGFGYNIGMAYDFSENGAPGLTIGAQYKSSIKMTYDNQLSNATAPFVALGVFPVPMSDDLEQPAEFGVGLAYVYENQHTFAFDYKRVKWSDADGYGDFGWDDGDVYAFGYQYAQDNWAFRAGYNRSDSVVVEIPGGSASPAAAALNFFNLLGFPANSEQHYTLGGSYEFSEMFSVDLAYVYSPKTTDTFDIGAFAGLGLPPAITTSHREDSVSFQLAYKF